MNFQSKKKFWKAETRGFSNIPLNTMNIDTVNTSHISNAFNAMYVDTVDTKHIHTFLPITFLIFKQFSIQLNTMYVNTVNTSHKYS